MYIHEILCQLMSKVTDLFVLKVYSRINTGIVKLGKGRDYVH